ncbi:MAG: endopeptidase La [Tissierellia bacterium]|nr:endopeptidase La [Tissierellia bacterium]
MQEERMNILPVVPLRDLVIFPGMVTHFDAGRSKSIAALEAAQAEGSQIFLTAQRDMNVQDPAYEDVYSMGTLATIRQVLRLPGGVVRVLVEGLYRGQILEFIETEPLIRGQVLPYPDPETINEDGEIEALVRLVREDLKSYGDLNSKLFPGLLDSVVDASHPGRLADTAGGYIGLDLENSQKLLETLDVKERLFILHGILSREVQLLAIENDIDEKVKQQMGEVQKEYFLKEQIRVINDELGEGGSEESIHQEYADRLKEKDLPQETRDKAEKELRRLKKMNSQSPEYSVITSYLDWILDLPWLEGKEENIDILKARKILDKDHYGLEDVKERILEFIAVRKKAQSNKGSILCLVGPPGVGKTSVARSVARALDKAYVRMSLGGMTDESEIRGHRRTYVGSLPGRIISLMKEAGENNPLFLLDEIDKVGNDYRGDPASALLEVLDPAQNSSFTDRYLELPFDLSQVFFITTANSTRTIPEPLLDRMELIQIGGYTPEEKFQIAKLYLVPRQLKETGLKPEEFSISDNAIQSLIDFYTREAGVRALEKAIAKIMRKGVLELYEEDKDRIFVTNRNLAKYMGEKKFLLDDLERENPVGMVRGLAWTSVGGTTLNIETNALPGKGKLQLTGQLGDVMKESAQAAISYLYSQGEALGIAKDYRETHDLHIHVPEGATPKDGPSAGIAIATALYSTMTGRPVHRDIAMTGEVTLRGNVLPIGGLKEKLLAAQQIGVKRVLIPEENKRDLKKIDSPSLQKMEIIPVSTMEEVLREAIVYEDQES